MKPPYNSHIQALILSTKEMYLAHPTLNIYIQVDSAGLYKLSKEEDFTLTKTEMHLVSEPCIIVG